MWRFVLRRNIAHYQAMLMDEPDEGERATLETLLTEAMLELADLETLSNRDFVKHDNHLQLLAQQAVNRVVGLSGAQFGNLQLYDPDSRRLVIIAQTNFRKPFLQHFADVTAGDGSACGQALLTGKRMIIEDVTEIPMFGPHLSIARQTGFRAVQSTPLYDKASNPIGMLSTHYVSLVLSRKRSLYCLINRPNISEDVWLLFSRHL